MRKPFQGLWNIVRFNWHFYVVFLIVLSGGLFLGSFLSGNLYWLIILCCLLAVIFTLSSLVISYFIYDRSSLYSLSWLKQYSLNMGKIINIHSGFDETSSLLLKKYPLTHLTVYDFYDPVKHTEISIKRARRLNPPFPGTIGISSTQLPAAGSSADSVFLLFAAHEIRQNKERIQFFSEIRRVLADNGKVIVVEHLRDLPNFLAYSVGFLHFHSRNTWMKTFSGAELKIVAENKLTPFVTIFILQKHAPAS